MNDKIKKLLAYEFRVDIDRVDEVESYRDYAGACTVYVLDGRRFAIADHVLRTLDPPKDPMVEAFTATALAMHEAEKRRDRDAA